MGYDGNYTPHWQGRRPHRGIRIGEWWGGSSKVVTAQRRYTLFDLLEPAALPDDDRIYDLVGGRLVVRNIPDVNHGALLTELFGPFYLAQQAGLGRVFSSTTAVALDYPARGEQAQDVTHPDLCFIRADREGIIGDRVIEGAPDLVVEILSHSTRAEHAPGGALRATYARHGVPHSWLADPIARTIAQHTLLGERYVGGRYALSRLLHAGDTLTTPLLPDLALSLDRVFRFVRPARSRGR